MKDSTKNRIQEIIQNGYNFNFGDYISEGFNIMNKNVGSFIAFFLIYAFLSLFSQALGALSIFSTFILTPIMLGLYLVAHKVQTGKPHEFGDFFKGFQFIGPIALLLLIQFGLYLLAMLPFGLYMGLTVFPELQDISLGDFNPSENPEYFLEILTSISAEVNSFLILLTLLPVIYLGISWSFAPFFVIFYNYSPWDALETSRKLITKKWGLIFLIWFSDWHNCNVGNDCLFYRIIIYCACSDDS